MGFTDIVFEKKDGVAIVTFTREEARNAIRYQTWLDIQSAVKKCAKEDDVRAVIITGKGKAFSAGEDLADMAKFLDEKPDFFMLRQFLMEIQEITSSMMKMKKPIIAALNGYVVGAGAEIAIASDIRIASEKATFEFAEVKVGLFETNGVTYLLPRLIGLRRAMELMLTGRRIDAYEAKEIGLVSFVVKPEELLEEAMKLADTMAQNAPVSMANVKNCLYRSGEISLTDALTYETEAMMACSMTDDAKEGPMAFFEKRKPNFKGK